MSREIKFRVFDDKTGKFNYFDLSTVEGHMPSDCKHKVGQYTGLKDKNDKEIYEGDIVKVNKNHEAWVLGTILKNPLPEYDRGEIRMSHGCWKICQKRMGAAELYDYSCCEEHPCALEVIGNIFEHPELPAPE